MYIKYIRIYIKNYLFVFIQFDPAEIFHDLYETQELTEIDYELYKV